MAHNKDSIKVIEGALALGFRVSEAVQRALGTTLTDFAGRHAFTRQSVTMCLMAYEGRTYSEIRDAICAELEIPREYLDRLIDSQRATADEPATDPAA